MSGVIPSSTSLHLFIACTWVTLISRYNFTFIYFRKDRDRVPKFSLENNTIYK